MRLPKQSEVRRTADSDTKRIGGQARPEQEALPEDGGAWGGWRRNDRKCMIMNQGDLSRCWKERGRSQSSHRSDETCLKTSANGRKRRDERCIRPRRALWMRARKADKKTTGSYVPVSKRGAPDSVSTGPAGQTSPRYPCRTFQTRRPGTFQPPSPFLRIPKPNASASPQWISIYQLLQLH